MQEVLNKKNPTFIEILENAAKAESPVESLKRSMSEDSRVAQVLGYAFNPNFKMPLPDGIPPYIPSEHPLGLAEVELLHLFNKFYVMFNKESTKARKEQMFIQWLEKMHDREANVLVHIKDQTLHTLYPELTEEVFITALGWDKFKYEEMKRKAKQA